MRSQTEAHKRELIDIISHADDQQIEALYRILVEPVNILNSFDFSDEQKKELDEQKKLHRAGKTKSYTVAEVRRMALKRLKKRSPSSSNPLRLSNS